MGGKKDISYSGHLVLCYLPSPTFYFERDLELLQGLRATAKLQPFAGCFSDGLPKGIGAKQKKMTPFLSFS